MFILISTCPGTLICPTYAVNYELYLACSITHGCLCPSMFGFLLVHALAYSVLRYGITVFGICSGRWQAKVNTLLRGILTNILYNTPLSATADIFETLQLPNFHSLFIETVLLRNFWSSDYKTPLHSSRTLRSSPRFVVPRCCTRYGKCSRESYVPRVFNALPDYIYDIASLKTLKK